MKARRSALLATVLAVAAVSAASARGAVLNSAPTFDCGTHVPIVASRLCRLHGGSDGSSLKNWWFKTLAKLGIFLKKGRLLVLGLDNAGKSTLLTVLLRNEVVPTAPTHQPVTDELKIGHMKLRAVDMGGHEIARKMWLQYSHEADGIVYIVDAVDRERVRRCFESPVLTEICALARLSSPLRLSPLLV